MAAFFLCFAASWYGIGMLYALQFFWSDRKENRFGFAYKLACTVFWPVLLPVTQSRNGAGPARIWASAFAMLLAVGGVHIASVCEAALLHAKRLQSAKGQAAQAHELGELNRLSRLLPLGGRLRTLADTGLASLRCVAALKQSQADQTGPALELLSACKAELARLRLADPAAPGLDRPWRLALLAEYTIKKQAAVETLRRGDRPGAEPLLQGAQGALEEALRMNPADAEAAGLLNELRRERGEASAPAGASAGGAEAASFPSGN